MNRKRWAWLTLWAALGHAPAAFADDRPGDTVEVGFARVDITPTSPVRLGGYLVRTKESEGVSQPIWAKAMAIGGDAKGPVVLVAVDNLGVGEAVVEEVSRRLSRSSRLPRSRFTVASSHTHSAPCLTGVAPNIFGKPIAPDEQSRIDAYTRDLTDKIERVSIDALKARKPGRLSWSQGRVDFAANRRTKGGPVDHALPVLRASGLDGSTLGVLVNYACHCTTIDPKVNKVSGDWAGFAQAAIEADHPGAVALTVIGYGADANPMNRQDPNAARDHGRRIADEFNRLIKGPWVSLDGPPETSFERLSLPFDTLPTRNDLDALVKQGGPPGYNASTQIARLDRGEPLPSRLNYSVQSWRFGDKLAMVFLPGEVVVDYALRIKREFDAKRLWVTAYANDDPCYIPSERILREGGYEGGGAMVYYGHPTRLKPGVEQIIMDGVSRVVPDAFKPSTAAPAADDAAKPKTPEESVRLIRLKPGLKAELVAAEPLVQSPVAIDFGADGKLWVCEMRDYPTGIDGHWAPGGVVKYLEDRDGDDRYDTATEFLTGLPFPTGVMAWRKGVLICAAPEIIYAEDTDGDGKADVRKVLFQGFATENYQARVNGLSYGLDNWVYGANGLIGGSIRGNATGRVVDIGGRDFRIKPDTGVMEPASGLTQQGRVHDDWDNQFGGNNSVWFQHYPLPDHAARRNPFVAAPDPAVNLSRGDDWSRLFPASRTVERFNHPESANRVTSACSPLIYRDDWLGPEYKGNAFTCEPVHNLVHREVLTPEGVTFSGRRAPDEQTSEFLGSTDHWFRPVQVRTGPDGALWVVDMYRSVIEHPRWISPEQLATLDVRAGADKGRIYRVVREGQPPRPVPVLDRQSSADLAARLDNPNGTLRETVQRVLVHRGGRNAVPTLLGVARNARHPEGRAQALATLVGLGALDAETVRAALDDAHPGVRRQAVRLSEPWLGKDERVGVSVLSHAADPDVGVRFQVALGLGEWDDPAAGEALGRIATRDAGDIWVRSAVLSSCQKHAADVLVQVVAGDAKGDLSLLIEPLLATVVGSGDRRAVSLAVSAVTSKFKDGAAVEPWRFGAVAQLLESTREGSLAAEPGVAVVARVARARAADDSLKPVERATAVRLLGRVAAHAADDHETLSKLLDPSQPQEVQSAAVRALAREPGDAGVAEVIRHWPGFGPVVQSSALDTLLARGNSAGAVVEALEKGRLSPSAVDAAHRQTLLSSEAPALRRRARAVFERQSIGPRKAVLDAFATVRTMPGDAGRGKVVFTRVCAGCHKVAGVGHEVGPDLAALTDTTADALLTAILDPNRDVDARYAGYTAALKDGRVLSGLIAAETATGLTLKRQEGQSDVVLRTDLDALKATGQSLMPEGLENDLKPVDLADVIAFLARGVRRPKELAGNHPETVVARPDGVVRLDATRAEVYGPTLAFEAANANLGYWQSADDVAVWTLKTERPATYTVSMEWACADESAGNAFAVKVGGAGSVNTVGGTGAGTWANYHSIFLFEATLPAGTHRLEVRPTGEPRGALLDLKAVVLTPRSQGVFRSAKP